MSLHWSSVKPEEISKSLKTDLEKGLEYEEVQGRLERDGLNLFKEGKGFSWISHILIQFKNPLVFVLLGALVVTLVIDEHLDALVIFIALLINFIIGLLEEKRADNSFKKLSESQQKNATVIRGGKRKTINRKNLVRGDLVILEGGMQVPADLRLIAVQDLTINESALTGEWVAVTKEEKIGKPGRLATEQLNMAFMGTLVVSGFATGIVVETGNNTEIGKIAESLAFIEETDTPIKKNIKRLARFLSFVVLVLLLFIFGLGIWRGENVTEMLLISIAVAVSAIPEGLPAAVTVVLAVGMEKILSKGGLVKNLLAAETLGGTTIILTDKTGTLTEASMKMSAILTIDNILDGSQDIEDNLETLKMAILSSDAYVEEGKEKGSLTVHGRPIEKAILTAGLEAGISERRLNSEGYGRIDFLPFTSSRRFAASLNQSPKWPNRIYFSGEPETLLDNSSKVWRKSGSAKKTKHWEDLLRQSLSRETGKGLRLIAIAYKDVSWNKINDNKELIEDMVFVGFLAFKDPVRRDVKEAILKAKGAGARVIMVTGDYPETAHEIAKEVGISDENASILTGKDIELMKDSELAHSLLSVNILARVLPEQKLRIANILRNKGEVVAMTGDGINDAPALRSADIGVAVESGTEVAKEASDLILLGNSFSIIVSAIEEGRRIIDNLKKIIGFLLSTSFGEVLIIAAALALALPLPILPTQILWLNIIGEGLMNFAFAFEPPEKNIMKRSPRTTSAKNILSGDIKKLIVAAGLITSAFLIILYLILLELGLPIEEIRTIMFVALSLDSIFFTFSFKNLTEPFWNSKLSDNRYLLFAFSTSVIILILTLLLAPLRSLLSLSILTYYEVLLLVGVGIFNLLTIEVSKKLIFGRS